MTVGGDAPKIEPADPPTPESTQSNAPAFQKVLLQKLTLFLIAVGKILALIFNKTLALLRFIAPYCKRFVKWSFKWGTRIFIFFLPVLIVLLFLLYRELSTSRWQAKYLSRIAKEASFEVAPGASDSIWFPNFGPFDQRLGYTKIPDITESLTRAGYKILKQARISPRMKELVEMGIFAIYREKTRSGITILDRKNTTIYSSYRPANIFGSFDEIPSVILNSLLFIENREILDPKSPTKNPAIEWDRLAKAVLEKIIQIFKPNINAPGGSTIATQLEKYRHSREGRTTSIRDKFLQMASASIRAYMYGEETTQTRKQIVLQYVNSIPLAALPGYGEVNGLGDGLSEWYGGNFESSMTQLRELSKLPPDADPTPYATAYKQVLSLFIAHRRPSYFLLNGVGELDKLTNAHLDRLASENIISAKLAVAAKNIQLALRRSAPKQEKISFIQRKAANAIRTRLLQLTNLPQLYDLDQLDLTVKSTIDNNASEAVTDVLKQIKDQDSVKKLGLGGDRNLNKGDPSKVIYSLTLYERLGNANLLRIQTDNFDKPFSINEGTRLDLGSTAKLRTLTTYLEIVSEIYDVYKNKSEKDIKQILSRSPDPITDFVLQALLKNPTLELKPLLDDAMERHYSANPGETFFTGGGIHQFVNFRNEDNGRNPTLTEALANSINLPFVRLMRDIVRYETFKMGIQTRSKDSKDPMRQHFLSKFADQEGSDFLRQFYKKYKNTNPSELLPTMVKGYRASPRHAAAMYRYVRPNGSVDDLAKFLRDNLANTNISLILVQKMYDEFAPGKFSLNDQGFLAHVHPLELWLVKYLQDNPNAPVSQALEASAKERQEVYEWLFKSPSRHAQDTRIRTLMEVEAFLQIHKRWKRLGYPFNSMVPSLASAIGSSGDRPVALAELAGIILNDGYKLPLIRLDQLHFAAGTPFETLLERGEPAQAEQVLKPEIASCLRTAMIRVVEQGTARRAFQSFKRSDGKAYTIGGKTGTGDHRYETFGAGGQLLSSRVVNRTATFVFFIGDRFFGVISAHVPGAEAAKFDFTSSLASQLLKILSPSLVPMIEESGAELAPKGYVEEKKVAATPTPAPDVVEGASEVQPVEVPPIPSTSPKSEPTAVSVKEENKKASAPAPTAAPKVKKKKKPAEDLPVVIAPPA